MKFGIVGLTNTLLNLAIYYILVALGINYLIANAAAFVLSVLNSYFWNNRYVFKKRPSGHLKALAKVYICYGATFALSTLLLYIMVSVLGVSEYIAPLPVLVVTVPLNFLLNKFWAFR